MEVNKDGFLCCPSCGKKTKTKVRPETVLLRFPLYCTWCKQETIIDIQKAGAKAPELSPENG